MESCVHPTPTPFRPARPTTLLATLMACAFGLPASAATLVYVSNADSQEVSVLELDRAAGQLRLVETVPVGGTVMPLAVSPDKKFLYAALRSQPFRVVSFSIEAPSGRLKKLGEASLADSMANIDVDRSGKWLFAASYGGHKITVNGIDAKGAVGAVQQLLPTTPNAHAIHADASNQYVLATSLGGDNLSVWRFDATKGQLSANDPALVTTAPKSGARHFVWSASQKHLYLLNELDASLDVFAWDSSRGTLRPLQRSTALPAGFTGKPWAADVHLSPDGRFLYASERTSSTIAIFRVDSISGVLQPAGHAATEKTPRGFAIDATGRFLVAAGQESHAVALYPIDQATGTLGAPQRLPVGKNPNWVEIVELP
jgi:6-phosphogluconolactonase